MHNCITMQIKFTQALLCVLLLFMVSMQIKVTLLYGTFFGVHHPQMTSLSM